MVKSDTDKEDDDIPSPNRAKKKWLSLSSSPSPSSPPQWLPLPHIVMAMFGLNIIFIMVAVVVSGLVLSGTIQVTAKAIGLTQSLVLFSSVFGIAYVALYVYASRKAENGDGDQLGRRSSLHTRILVIGRITAMLWTVSLIAVGITLGSQPADDPSKASSLGALRANLAACLINCLDMVSIALVVERTSRPFVLPWVSPPIPDSRPTSPANALIKDILGDGVSGHPTKSSDQAVKAETEYSPSREDSSALKKAEKHEFEKSTTDLSVAASSTILPFPSAEPFPSAGSTLVDRQELWNKVDEGGGATTPGYTPLSVPQLYAVPQFSSIPPLPSPAARAGSPYTTIFAYSMPPQTHGYVSPLQQGPASALASPAASTTRPPLTRSVANGVPRYGGGPRPYPAGTGGGHTAYSGIQTAEGGRIGGPRPVGKRLFNKAVEGLKAAGYDDDSGWDDWSTIRVPGSFIEV